MKSQKQIEKVINQALTGKGAHVDAENIVAGLNWRTAGVRPKGVSHSIFQLLNHIIFWQQWVAQWLEGEDPQIPREASGSWPGAESPSSQEEWQQAVDRFMALIEQNKRQSSAVDLFKTQSNNRSALQMLQTIASHNSYHLGQLALIRQMLDAWPPPGGGLTW